ncbi:glutamyl-tRNA reductase [Oleiphilus sp. HI0125]|uniref:glutamyl-tRNA reductase n=1 Tax=Oleiphilus sp. HI0125 TaxID=1822266 RepID=UPI0007C384F0|nr:glutamyl-tRNA reductase [Oleiphilus sp. HI0125]KZZ59299.1 glutamyl-tRNA reductase [Oleiphilus sp. HI0125]
MSILAFGINHKTAPIELREKVAFDPLALMDALSSFVAQHQVSEGVILSTCNRTEIYCSVDGGYGKRDVSDWLAKFHRLNVDLIERNCFCYGNDDAVRHVMRVAAGLESLVLGEPQILGQLKSAYASALEAGSVTGRLGRLLETSFSTAKQVRTETAIGESAVSVAATSVVLAKQLFGQLSQSKALLVGAGKTTELVAKHLRQAGIKDLTIANRTLARAQDLVDEVGGQAALIGDIPDLLVDVDIVISSTASPLPVLGKGAVERALKLRKHRPFFMVDIAVPRDIEPQVGELADVYLYTVDDLANVIDENKRSRERAADDAESIINAGVRRFTSDLRISKAGDGLRRFRAHAENIRLNEVEKAVSALQQGADPEKVVRSLSRTLTQKLLHEPTVSVRDDAAAGKAETAQLLLNLFKLDEE